jgi:hypothetical protein
LRSIAELHHFYAAPTPGEKNYAVPAPTASPFVSSSFIINLKISLNMLLEALKTISNLGLFEIFFYEFISEPELHWVAAPDQQYW